MSAGAGSGHRPARTSAEARRLSGVRPPARRPWPVVEAALLAVSLLACLSLTAGLVG